MLHVVITYGLNMMMRAVSTVVQPVALRKRPLNTGIWDGPIAQPRQLWYMDKGLICPRLVNACNVIRRHAIRHPLLHDRLMPLSLPMPPQLCGPSGDWCSPIQISINKPKHRLILRKAEPWLVDVLCENTNTPAYICIYMYV